MHLCTCENPSYVYNRYLDRDVRVNCGKCNSCLNARAKRYITALEAESRLHKYAFMVNLTYDDKHLPVVGLSDDLNSLEYVNRDAESIPLHEVLAFDNSPRDIEYLSSRLRDPLMLPVPFIKDVQDFLKRLNKRIHDKFTNTYENFRYFFCTEIGGTTFRTHYHGIIYFDSDPVADNFQSLISSCWSLGDSPVDNIFSRGGFSYVAQYVNKLSDLPAFYEHSKLHQTPIFSKFPSLGSRALLDSEVREVYDRKPINRSVFDPASGTNRIVPIEPAFKNRFFPQCPQYNTRSYTDRVPLYRATQYLPSFDFQEFYNSANKLEWLASRCLCSPGEKVIHLYIQDLKRNAKSEESFKTSLYKLFLVSKRTVYIAKCMRSSVENVVKHIDMYYKKVDYDRLKQFYEWQSIYSQHHPVSELMFAYPDLVRDYMFYEKYPKIPMSDTFVAALDSFNIDVLNPPDFNQTADFKSMISINNKIYNDTHKNHQKNGYLFSQKFGYLNPSLQKIMIKYHTSKDV